MPLRHYERFQYNEDEQPDPNNPSVQNVSGVEAVGNVVIAFADLEEQLALSVAFLIGRSQAVGDVITAELSFKVKLHIFGSLFRHLRPASENLQRLEELLGVINQAEEFRNQVVHSSWRHDFETLEMARRKRSAKMTRGYRVDEQSLRSDQIQDLASHFYRVGFWLDELLYLEFGTEYGTP